MLSDQRGLELTPIGTIQTPFTEKFGVPRQSGLLQSAWGIVRLNSDPRLKLAIQELDRFSHLWLFYLFDRQKPRDWRPLIAPPRLGGPERVGVFASRSPDRPNPIGMSAVKLERIEWDSRDSILIHVSGVDVLDQTPVIDLKPYLPYADSHPDALPGWVQGEIPRYEVEIHKSARPTWDQLHPADQQLICEMASLDPRPTSQKRGYPPESLETEAQTFAFRVLNFDVSWKFSASKVIVLSLTRILYPS